jgi:4-hydroxythreonine-4-phosphate dehydrogenase
LKETQLAPVRLAITLGDPRGIGPEVALAATRSIARADSAVTFAFIGPEGLGDFPGELISIGAWNRHDGVDKAGTLAGLALDRAIALALGGEVAGIVTAPLDKYALHAGGYDFPGHTEMLAARAGNVPVAMMMAAERTSIGGPLRVVLATTHLPLSAVPTAVTTPLLIEQTILTHQALRDEWQIVPPRIALCALNPHASDGGLFGDEETRVMRPAIEHLAGRGIRVSGPIPADTVFVRAARGEFDAVIAPYHDVGMAAFKTAAFGQGVNVTLGLPFVRTSPDHGTAIDIAGTGVADSSSMEEAIHLAIKLAARRGATAQR